jgi:hypothetical protein
LASHENYKSKLEKNFLCVHWDQRGAGKSYDMRMFNNKLTIDFYVKDFQELSKYHISKYNKQKIIYLSREIMRHNNWFVSCQRYPELFHANIGNGQVVNMMEGERISYEFTLDKASEENNEEAKQQLEAIGFTPLQNIKYLLIQRKWLNHYRGIIRNQQLQNMIFNHYLNNSLKYSRSDRLKLVKGNVKSHTYLWDQMLEINLLDTLTHFNIPMYYCVGRFDFNAPSKLIEKYFEVINSPRKKISGWSNLHME